MVKRNVREIYDECKQLEEVDIFRKGNFDVLSASQRSGESQGCEVRFPKRYRWLCEGRPGIFGKI